MARQVVQRRECDAAPVHEPGDIRIGVREVPARLQELPDFVTSRTRDQQQVRGAWVPAPPAPGRLRGARWATALEAGEVW